MGIAWASTVDILQAVPEEADTMPTAQQWKEKADASLSAARLCLDHDNLPGAANRLWYAIYHCVHAVLVHRGYQPRQVLDNWAHEDTVVMLFTVVRQLLRTRNAMNSLQQARRVISAALEWRIAADYGEHAGLDGERLRRGLSQISRVIEYLQEEAMA